MTPEEHRQLDASVAAKVMGIDVQYDREERGKFWQHTPNDPFDYFIGATHGLVPPYSTDIAAAWEVVEQLRAYSDTVSFAFDVRDNSEHQGPPEWLARFDRYHLTDEYDGSGGYWRADTAPHAICLAALQAVGAVESSQP